MARFAWLALLAAVVLGIVAFIGVAIIGVLETWIGKGTLTELLQTAILIGTYVVVALAYSTIYQATVKLRLWQQGFQSIELAGTEVLDGVKATGAGGSAVGEGARRRAQCRRDLKDAGFRDRHLFRRRDQRAPRRAGGACR